MALNLTRNIFKTAVFNPVAGTKLVRSDRRMKELMHEMIPQACDEYEAK